MEFRLEKAYANFECEKLATKYYKYTLGVHKKATDLAVYGELGRTPFFIDIICGVIKYYKRIQNEWVHYWRHFGDYDVAMQAGHNVMHYNDSLKGYNVHESFEQQSKVFQNRHFDFSSII